MDLDAYFSRIGFQSEDLMPGPLLLRTLIELHTRAIPFENFNPLLGLPVRIDIPSLEQKIVSSRRGGYCFEQNSLFREVLETLGFQVIGLGARVLWNSTSPDVPPRTHMLLLVKVYGEPFMVDVGFGANTPVVPLQLIPLVQQSTPFGAMRLLEALGTWTLQIRIQDQWRSLYAFDLTPQNPSDYEMANWFTSTYPQSHFKRELGVSIIGHDGQYALKNNQLSVYRSSGGTERRVLAGVAELRIVLEELFGIALPAHPGLEDVLHKALTALAVA